MNQTLKLPDFANVVAGKTATCDLLPVVTGRVLESIQCELGGTSFTRAHITAWRLKVNGKVIREGTGTNTNLVTLFNGITNAATYFVIDFMFPKFRTPQGFGVGALDTGTGSNVRQLVLEVDISGSATAPTLTADAEVSPSVDNPAERALRWIMLREHSAQVSLSAAGSYSIAQNIPHFLPTGGGAVYRSIDIFASSSDVTAIKIKRNGVDEFDQTVAKLQELQKRAGRSIQSGLISMDFCLDNLVQGRVFDTTPANGISSVDFIVTAAAAVAFTVTTRELLPLSAY